MPKVIVYDIESTNLHADFGYCLAFGYKELGGETKVLSVLDYPDAFGEDPTNDQELMRDAHRVLDGADAVVTFYGKEFDQKFLNSRMILADLSPLPPLGPAHVDLYYTAKHNLALHSNRLASVADFLGCPMKKTPLSGPTWVKASAGHKKSIKYVKEHCTRDVDILAWVYEKLKPFVRTHPTLFGGVDKCHICGSGRLQRRGITVTLKRPKQRVQCQNCGTWSLREIPVAKGS